MFSSCDLKCIDTQKDFQLVIFLHSYTPVPCEITASNFAFLCLIYSFKVFHTLRHFHYSRLGKKDDNIWDKVFKNGPSEFCGILTLKNLI